MYKTTLMISLLLISFSIFGFNFVNRANIVGQKDSSIFLQSDIQPQNDFIGKAGNKKILIVYFSHSGNTRIAAEKVKALTGADIIELKTVNKYSEDYKTVVTKARKELADNARPKLATKIDNLDDYDTIILAYPNWCGTMPMPIFSFLEQYDFKGKTIAPLCTHGNGGLGNSVKDMTKLVSKAKITDSFNSRGTEVKNIDNDLKAWLKKISVL